MDLTEFDDAAPPPAPDKRAEITHGQLCALAAPKLPCGLFTLTLTDGARKRFRVRLERGKFVPGQRTLSRYCKLAGDEGHEKEWETIAIVGPNGFNVFKRWRNDWEERWAVAIWGLVHGAPVAGYSLEIVPTCWMTGRKLKAEDVACGLCPTWQKRFGVKR